MKTIRFSILMAMLTWALCAAAQGSLTLQAPRQAIEGQKFSITFRLSNVQASAPEAPQLENCRLLFGPSTSTMQSTQIINGQVSSTVTYDYTYTYLAEKAGTVTIPAVSINAQGKRLSTDARQLNILPPDKTATPSPGTPGVPNSSANPGQAGTPINADDMFVRVSLNKTHVYEQEAVIATVKVYTRLGISSFRATVLPTFEGFLSEELSVPNTNETEHYNGKNYTTAVLKRCLLYPQKAGKLTINSGRYEVTVVQYETVSNGFFRTQRPVERQITTQSNEATLIVSELPSPKPASFNGAVGHFTASVDLKPTELRTNEAASYIYTIEGTGNIKYLKAPTLDLPAGIDQFTPKTDINASFTGSNMRGTYTVNFTLLPQEPGNFQIPPLDFSYFNPADREYHTIPLQGFDMRVAQGAGTSTITEQKSISKGINDIYHIKAVNGPLQKSPQFTFHRSYYWWLYGLSALALCLIILIYRRQLKLNADVRGRKLARANRVAAKRFKTAKALIGSQDTDKFYAEVNRALWGYISDKLGIPASQLLRDNIATQLAAKGVSDEDIAKVIDILDKCEMARFTPNHSDAEMSQLYQEAVSAVKSIENTKPVR